MRGLAGWYDGLIVRSSLETNRSSLLIASSVQGDGVCFAGIKNSSARSQDVQATTNPLRFYPFGGPRSRVTVKCVPALRDRVLTYVPQTLVGRSASQCREDRVYRRRYLRRRNHRFCLQQHPASGLVLSEPHTAAVRASFHPVLGQVSEHPLQRSAAPRLFRPARQFAY